MTRAWPTGAVLGLLAVAGGCGGDEPPAGTGPAIEALETEPTPLTRDPVRIYYDALRVPHVFAEDDLGAFYGLGYAQVRDFPVATLATLWSTSGRYAEVAGRRVLPRDLRVRAWGIDQLAHSQATDDELLDPGIRALLAAYVDGVNAGRRFWSERPQMIAALVGEERELWIDPVPPWLNPMFSGADPLVVLQHLFAAEVELTHVLALGVAFNAGPEFASGGNAMGTNVWLARNPAEHASVLGLMDAHQPIKRDGDLRSYLVQLHGQRFRLAGITMPGWPCVFSGFNHDVFYGLSTPPKAPGKVRRAKAPFRLNERVPYTREVWEAELDTVELEQHVVQLRVFDAGAGKLIDDPRGPRFYYRVPAQVEPLASRGLGHLVTSPAPGTKLDRTRTSSVRFEGRSFLSARNALETFLKLGMCERVGAGAGAVDEVLGDAGLSFGRAEVFLAGDAQGGFEYVFLSNPAIPGPAGKEARTWTGDEPLDGGDSAARWEGFYDLTALPRLVEPQGFGEDVLVWLNCNSSPHFVRAPAAGAYIFDGPPWVYDDQAWTTLRHERARELFGRLPGKERIALADVEAIALDVQDAWSVRMWPWIAALRGAGISEYARRFLDWAEDERFEELPGSGAREEFLAHTRSQVMPFLTLYLAWLEAGIAALPEPTPDEIAFAFDPVYALPETEAFSKGTEWQRVRDVMVDVLEGVAALHVTTLRGEEGGLATRRFLAGLSACAPVVPIGWKSGGAALDGPLPTWGEVNQYVATPHVVPQPVRDAHEGWLVSLLAPCTFENLAPFYSRQRTAAAPVPGTRTSIFHAHALDRPTIEDPLVATDVGPVYVVPVDFGSQVLFAVELTPDGPPQARVLPALGATEILVDLPENGTRADDHFAPLAAFLAGQWSDLELREEVLREASRRKLELAR